jgi:hypothetical protein
MAGQESAAVDEKRAIGGEKSVGVGTSSAVVDGKSAGIAANHIAPW